MPIHTSWKSMAKGMKTTYCGKKKAGPVKCRPFTDGSRLCMCAKAWQVFFASVNKMGADETKPRPKKVKTQEAVEKILEWYKAGFGEGAWKLPKQITKTIFFKHFYVPIPKVGKFKGKKATWKVTKVGKGMKSIITVHKTYKVGKRTAWTKETGTKRQWARMASGYKGPMIGTAISSGFMASKEKKEEIMKWFIESTLKSSDLPTHSIPNWIGLAEKVLKSPKISEKVKAYWRKRLDTWKKSLKRN